jgi:hypothetical protein
MARLTLPVGILALLLSAFACSSAPTAPVPLTLSGDWLLSVVAAPVCYKTLPLGYGGAPHSGGKASLVQTGNSLKGTLYISDTPSGDLDGTIDGKNVRFAFRLDGRNVGVSAGKEPCRVVGEATGTTDGHCWLSVKISGDFACPYSCTADDHILALAYRFNQPTACGR